MKSLVFSSLLAAGLVVAVSVPGHARAAGATDECARQLPEGGELAASPGDVAVEPVRGSALITSPRFAVNELRTRGRAQDRDARFLAFDGKEGASGVFAELRPTGTPRTGLAWAVPPRSDLEAALRRLAVFEHLYAYLLHEPPLIAYEVRGPGPRTSRAQTLSQPQLLVRLARMRQCAASDVARRGGRVTVRAWEMPSVGVPLASGGGRLHVSVRVSFPQAGENRGSITIARGAHMTCNAQVDKDGVAACTLFDSHGHAEHGDELSGPTVVTYSGVVEPTRIVLPITRIEMDRATQPRRPSSSGTR